MRKLITSYSHLKAVLWTAVLVTVVTLGACGVDKPAQGVTEAGKSGPAKAGSPAGSPIKACELMPQPEAEVAVGQALPKTAEDGTLGMCTRSAEDFSAGAALTVRLNGHVDGGDRAPRMSVPDETVRSWQRR